MCILNICLFGHTKQSLNNFELENTSKSEGCSLTLVACKKCVASEI